MITDLLQLARRSEVALFAVDVQGASDRSRHGFDFDFAPPAVTYAMARMVSENVLIAKLTAYSSSGFRKVLQFIDRNRATAGCFGDFSQEPLPRPFLIGLEHPGE